MFATGTTERLPVIGFGPPFRVSDRAEVREAGVIGSVNVTVTALKGVWIAPVTPVAIDATWRCGQDREGDWRRGHGVAAAIAVVDLDADLVGAGGDAQRLELRPSSGWD